MPNFRNPYKSDHLSTPDLEEMIEEKKSLVFTIKQVKQEQTVVAGQRGLFNIAYFKEDIKPLVLNSGNANIVRGFTKSKSIDVDKWEAVVVELYVDFNVKMKGEIKSGIRIKPLQPKPKVKPDFTEANFEAAKKANATIEQIKMKYNVSKEIEELWNK